MCVAHALVRTCVHKSTPVYVCMRCLHQLGMGTLTGLLLGIELVALVTQAGVGAWQVPAACLPTGICVSTFIYICKKNQQTGHSYISCRREGCSWPRPTISEPDICYCPGWQAENRPLRDIPSCRVPWSCPFPLPLHYSPFPHHLQSPHFLPSTGLCSCRSRSGLGVGGISDQGPY